MMLFRFIAEQKSGVQDFRKRINEPTCGCRLQTAVRLSERMYNTLKKWSGCEMAMAQWQGGSVRCGVKMKMEENVALREQWLVSGTSV